MKRKILHGMTGVCALVILGIVGAVERGADIGMMWWTLPCLAVIAIAAGLQDFAKNFFDRGGVKHPC